MRPGVGADGVAGGGDLLENFRMIGGVLADREKRRLGAFLGQRLEHRGGGRPRTVVEGQHHFLVGEEVELLELLEAEARPARVSTTTTRLTPSASGLAHFLLHRRGRLGAEPAQQSAAVTSTSCAAQAAWRRRPGSGSAFRALTVWGGAASARGEEVQNHTAAITTAETTVASIRPNALRIVTLSTKFTTTRTGPINANEVLTPHQRRPARPNYFLSGVRGEASPGD